MNTVTLEHPIVVDADEESLYARVGKMLGLKSVHTEVDLIDRVESGLTFRAVQNLQSHAGLTDAETYELIAPRRTLQRREATGQSLSTEEADKVVRVARVFARAGQVFANGYASSWLREPKETLGDRIPLQLLETELGAQAVEEQLIAIDHGIF